MADEIVGQTTSPTPSPESVQTTPTATTAPTEDGWNDSKFEAINTKYKSDSKEMAKALWHKDREFTKMQQELQQLKSQSSKPQSDNGQNPTQTPDQKTQSQQPQNQEKDAQNANETKPLPTYVELNNKIYREVFESGKISDETLQSLVQEGMTEADARIWAKANEYAISETKKEAQSYVSTPLDELKKFAEAEGNFTDDELNQIQSALNKGFYGVLKDVERKYKSFQKVKVEHGDAAAGKVNTEGFSSFKEWQDAKSKARTYQEIQEVEKRAMNSDMRNWHKQSFGY